MSVDSIATDSHFVTSLYVVEWLAYHSNFYDGRSEKYTLHYTVSYNSFRFAQLKNNKSQLRDKNTYRIAYNMLFSFTSYDLISFADKSRFIVSNSVVLFHCLYEKWFGLLLIYCQNP